MIHNAEVFRQAAECLSRGAFADAAAISWAWLAAAPDDGQIWQLFGISLWGQQRRAEALPALERASCLAPLFPMASQALADCYVHSGQRELGIDIYRWLVEWPRCPSVLLPSIAASLNALGAYDLALQACRVLVARDPANHQAHFGIAYYLARLGAPPEELIAPLAAAMDLAPTVLQYRINLAHAWTKLGHPGLADDLLAPIGVEELTCACWLKLLRGLFRRIGNHQRAAECTCRIRALAKRRGSGDDSRFTLHTEDENPE